VRRLIQRTGLPVKQKQQLFNFFVRETAPGQNLHCTMESRFGRVRAALDPGDDLSLLWYYWGYTGYEPGVTRLLCTLLKDKACVFDVGANIGYYSLLMAVALRGRGQVHAFEPTPAVYSALERNAALNHLPNLVLNRCALADRDAAMDLFLPADGAWTNASLVEHFTAQSERVVVQAMRFDSYCSRHAITCTDLVKLDAEGAELSVLRGMGELLLKWRPDIICEVLEPFAKDLDEFFADTPYRRFLITDDRLEAASRLEANPRYRDYFLTCSPEVPIGSTHCGPASGRT
jgi:FkbM family methyltransferase